MQESSPQVRFFDLRALNFSTIQSPRPTGEPSQQPIAMGKVNMLPGTLKLLKPFQISVSVRSMLLFCNIWRAATK